MRRTVNIKPGYPIPRSCVGPCDCMRQAAVAAACWVADGQRGFCFTGEMKPNDRSRLAFMIRYAVRHPGRIVPHARRLARDAVLRLRNRDHVSYYRAVMRSDAARSDEGAVGSRTHESWLKLGQMQFDYLVSHG